MLIASLMHQNQLGAQPEYHRRMWIDRFQDLVQSSSDQYHHRMSVQLFQYLRKLMRYLLPMLKHQEYPQPFLPKRLLRKCVTLQCRLLNQA